MGNTCTCHQVCISKGQDPNEIDCSFVEEVSPLGLLSDPQDCTPDANQWGDQLNHFNIDQESEIEEIKQYINQEEKDKGLVFSKDAILSYIESILEDTSTREFSKIWDQKIKSAKVNFYLKKGTENPYLLTETIYDKKWKMHKLINAIIDPSFKK